MSRRALKQNDVLGISKLYEAEFNRPDLHDRVLVFDVVGKASWQQILSVENERSESEANTQSEVESEDESSVQTEKEAMNAASEHADECDLFCGMQWQCDFIYAFWIKVKKVEPVSILFATKCEMF
ncbi:Hypothetical predicted protein [Paramuricea clavata]|uniref:Uncharacterized protein n=1 Tax=Paramuricea clavata TaxID=317549 RepID=A0A6S7KMJ7_PARCT|nr:Hypothetical predicted protein [Paramuricea clavata]